MPRLEQVELLGLLLTVGGAVFGLVYVLPALVTLHVTFGGVTGVSAGPQASLGLAGLSLTALGALAAMIIGQLRPPGKSIGGALIVWTDLLVLVLGDGLFYSGYTQDTTVLLFGVVSAFLMITGLWTISRRPRSAGLET